MWLFQYYNVKYWMYWWWRTVYKRLHEPFIPHAWHTLHTHCTITLHHTLLGLGSIEQTSIVQYVGLPYIGPHIHIHGINGTLNVLVGQPILPIVLHKLLEGPWDTRDVSVLPMDTYPLITSITSDFICKHTHTQDSLTICYWNGI